MSDGRLKPSREEFYQLVIAVQREQIIKLQAQAAIAERERALSAIVAKYGGDVNGNYRLDEEACELVAS